MPPRKHIDRQRVLEVSIVLADAHGFESVTLAGVAEQLGIRIPSLYNHISGLPGLRSDIAVWGVRQLADHMRRAATGKAGDDAITSMAQAYRAFAHAHPGVYPATLRASDEPELAALAQEVLEIIQTVLAVYQLSADDSLHVIRAFRSMIHGFVDLEIVGGFGLALDRDESFRQLVQLFVQGLHTRQAHTADS